MSQRALVDPFSKPFTWSYSKLKNFETCARRHLHVDLLRDIVEPPSEAVTWGNALHEALASAIGTDDNDTRSARDKIKYKPLSADYARYQPWVARITAARTQGARVCVEKSLAITRDFQPCSWFDPAAWYRARIDVDIVTADRRMANLLDWKTGKRMEDSPQLVMSAIAYFVHNPEVEAIRTEFVWLKMMNDDKPFDCTDRLSIWRKDVAHLWSGLAPRVRALEDAYNTRSYPPSPGFLCRRWCPVTTCEYHGR